LTNISYNSGDQELDLGWNAQYQLVAATNGSEVETYAYDALGRRVATVVGTTTSPEISELQVDRSS
jgi:YD repeat-containing protein